MKAYDQAKEDGHKQPAKVVAKQQFSAYYHGCIFKWKRTRERDQWPLVVAAAPKIAQRYKEVPNFIRQMLNQPPKFSHRARSVEEDGVTCILSPTFVELVAATAVTRFHSRYNLTLCHACMYIYINLFIYIYM